MMRYFVSIIVLIGLLGCYLFVYQPLKNENEDLSSDNLQLNNLNALLYNNVSIQFGSEGTPLDLSMKLRDIQGNEVPLYDLVGEEKLVVLRFSNRYCQICVDQELNLLQKVSKEVGSDKIMLLGDFGSFAEFRSFVRVKETGLDTRSFLMEEGFRSVQLETLGIPYVFLLDKNGLAEMVFVPSKDIPSLSQVYYSQVFERYFEHVLNTIY